MTGRQGTGAGVGAVVLSVALAAMLTGCGGSTTTTAGTTTTSTPVTTTNPATTTRILVIQNPTTANPTGAILQFAATSAGAVSPTGSIQAATGQSFNALTSDSSGNLYVASGTGTSAGLVEEFLAGSATSSGTASPQRTLPVTSTTQILNVNGLAASASGEIFVAEDSGAVEAFTGTATGSVAPARYIQGTQQLVGALSGLVLASAIASDPSDNLYVANDGSANGTPILVFGASATGNVAPIRALGGSATGLASGRIGGLATDASGNLYVTVNTVSGSMTTGTILEFGPSATGNATPVRTITGIGGGAYGIAVDSLGAIYVTTMSGSPTVPAVLTFPSSATGSASSTGFTSFTSTTWTTPDTNISLAVH